MKDKKNYISLRKTIINYFKLSTVLFLGNVIIGAMLFYLGVTNSFSNVIYVSLAILSVIWFLITFLLIIEIVVKTKEKTRT